MRELSMDRAKAIYRAAIDPSASDFEPASWWEAVRGEMVQVLSARTAYEAAVVIAWWHHDWSSVGDSARAAAGRIRLAGKSRAQPRASA